MKTFLSALGYKYASKKDDLNNKEFRHVNTAVAVDDETSTMGNIRNTITSEWELSLNAYDVSLFDKKIIELYDLCKNMSCKDVFNSNYDNGKSYYLNSYDVTTEQEENRTLLNITFDIRGL